MKHIKKYEDSKPKMFEPPKKHNPKHRYDCKNCKFNWCCGFECSCKLQLPEAPGDSLYGSIKKYNL